MEKLTTIVKKYHLDNVLKIIILLIVLYLIARLFMPTDTFVKTEKSIEGFISVNNTYYGNEISLRDPSNIPSYSGNTCVFDLDGQYRIDSIKLVFNKAENVLDSNEIGPAKVDSFDKFEQNLYLQYQDGNGNMRYISGSNKRSSPPSLKPDTSFQNGFPMLSLSNIVDENNLVIYTSKIIVVVGDETNKIDSYRDSTGNGYIKQFAIWGSTRDVMPKKDFENLTSSNDYELITYNKNNVDSKFDSNTNTNIDIFRYPSDRMIYCIKLDYSINSTSNNANPTPGVLDTTNSPFMLSIQYDNNVYAGNNFTINRKYTVRSDSNRTTSDARAYNLTNSSIMTTFIFLAQPIIANYIKITTPQINTTLSNNIRNINIRNMTVLGKKPNNKDITDYKRTVNLALAGSGDTGDSSDVCPSMDQLIVKQNQAQQICDNIEYQDKIKSEKLRLERNKQYLLKLKDQQEQIDKLNNLITYLDTKRLQRNKTADYSRVMQYQQQKSTSNSVRDIANQRLESQDNNRLFMNVNINTE
jgi:hypothetical protein